MVNRHQPRQTVGRRPRQGQATAGLRQQAVWVRRILNTRGWGSWGGLFTGEGPMSSEGK